MHQNPQVVFQNCKQMVQHAITSLVVKTMEQYVIPILDSYVIAIASFDLWMSKFGHDTFVLMINFINSLCVPCPMTMGIIETTNMFGIAMVVQVKDLLSSYNLLDKLIAYVKDKGDNLSTLTQALTLVVSYGPLGLAIPL